MKILRTFLIPIFVFSLFLVPVVTLAQAQSKGIVPDCTKIQVPDDPKDPNSKTHEECIWGFNEFIVLINNVISFLLFRLALPIAAMLFAYAGFLLLTSGGSEEKRSQAKEIFTKVALGLVVAAAAWLIINTLLSIFTSNQGDWSWIGFN